MNLNKEIELFMSKKTCELRWNKVNSYYITQTVARAKKLKLLSWEPAVSMN